MKNNPKEIKLKKALNVSLDLMTLIFIYIVITVFFGSIVWFLTVISEDLSDNIFKLKSSSDYYLTGLWLLSGVVPIVLLLLSKFKKIKLKSYHKILMIFEIAVFLPSAIFIFFKKESYSIEYITKVVSMTKIYFILLTTLLVAGAIISLYLTRSKLKNNNWWLLVMLTPYILVGWSVQKDFINYNNLVTSSIFEIDIVRKMLIETHGDIWLINDFFYKGIAIPILVLIILLGMIISEKIWKKIKQKRKKTKK